MLFSIPYIILILFYGGAALCSYSVDDEATRKRINYVCVLVYLFFFGFRGFIWDDWISYYPAFQDCSLYSIFSSSYHGQTFEIGFSLFMLLCKSIFDSYHFFIFVCTLINIILLYRFFSKRIKYLPLGLMLFICMEGLSFINILRNAIAILIFINSIEFIEQRKPLKFFSLCLIAISFHLSAILYIPTYFFLHRKINKWIFLSIFIVVNLVFILRVPLLSSIGTMLVGDSFQLLLDKIESYSGYKKGVGFAISIGYLERLFTFFMVFCYYNKLRTIRKENVIFVNSLLIYFALFFLFSEIDVVSKRLSALFVYSYWILWYDLIRSFAYRNNKWLYITFIGLYCILKTIGSTKEPTKLYDNVLWGARSYQESLIYHNRYHSE